MKSLSPGTLQLYKSATQCYLAFCHNFGIKAAFHLSEVILGHVVAFLANKHLSYVTIRVYLSALCFTQIASGLPDPSLSLFPRLDYILRSIRRSLPQYKRPKRLPITQHILWSLFCVWSHPPVTYNKVMLWAACCTGFFLASCTLESLLAPQQPQRFIMCCQFKTLGRTRTPILCLFLSTCITPRQTFCCRHNSISWSGGKAGLSNEGHPGIPGIMRSISWGPVHVLREILAVSSGSG